MQAADEDIRRILAHACQYQDERVRIIKHTLVIIMPRSRRSQLELPFIYLVDLAHDTGNLLDE